MSTTIQAMLGRVHLPLKSIRETGTRLSEIDPPRILKCKSVDREQAWVVPETEAYWYNANECFRLKDGVDFDKVALLTAEVETEFKAWSGKP